MAESKKDKNTVVCDQCGEEISQDDDRVVFALSKGFHLCSDCAQELVVNYRDAVKRHKTANSIKKNNKLTPSSILAFMKRYVIGQDVAAKILALAVYNHYKKLRYLQQHKDQKDAVELEKSNILMPGRSGMGKTHLIKTIARFLNVPYVIEDCTGFSASGSKY